MESLEAIERSTIVERKNDRDNRIDSFLDLYEKIKALKSKQERNFEPHQRSSLVTDNWHDRENSSLVSTDRFIDSSRKDDRELKVSERPIVITYKGNKNDFDWYCNNKFIARCELLGYCHNK